MQKKSAGLLLYRETPAGIEVLLAHPGGPLWVKKDDAAWSIPKGGIADGEDPLSAAKREFEEEIGFRPDGEFLPLDALRQPGGKLVFAWALRHDFDVTRLNSNMFSMEWPPGSGREREFPEVDRAEWFTVEAARQKILKGQAGFLDQLLKKRAGDL